MLIRKSSGAVVFNIHEGKVEILLVTSSSGKEWVFPKGGVEFDLSARASAAKEVYEEAGVLGNVGRKLGDYRYVKNNQIQEVTMYAMQYTGEADDWPEEHKRQRQWFKPKKAMAKVDMYLASFIHDVVSNIEASFAHEARKVG
ncbi:Diadenosine hexaphosphate hydrolase [compost metagenome]